MLQSSKLSQITSVHIHVDEALKRILIAQKQSKANA